MSSSCCCRDFCQTGQRTSARNSTTKRQDACQALDLLFFRIIFSDLPQNPRLYRGAFPARPSPSIDKFIDKLSSKSIKRPPASEPRRTLRLRQQESKSAAGLAAIGRRGHGSRADRHVPRPQPLPRRRTNRHLSASARVCRSLGGSITARSAASMAGIVFAWQDLEKYQPWIR